MPTIDYGGSFQRDGGRCVELERFAGASRATAGRSAVSWLISRTQKSVTLSTTIVIPRIWPWHGGGFYEVLWSTGTLGVCMIFRIYLNQVFGNMMQAVCISQY